ncbi:hypothetical protein [Agrococcus sp. Ld7]|uniref:hypothetical protein n=1 Tax=Agrococcus sp. Ld7 TaxID=649148 RepID=UPI003862E326
MVASFTFTRAGNLHADAERKLSQAVAEALSTVATGTTIVALCDADGVTTRRFVSGGDNARNRAYRAANSLNASSNEGDRPVDLFRSDLRRLAWPGVSSVENETQAGTALQAVSESIDGNLMAGDWIGISMREPTRAERSDWSRWFTHQRDARTHQRSNREPGWGSQGAGAAGSRVTRSAFDAHSPAIHHRLLHSRAVRASRLEAAAPTLVGTAREDRTWTATPPPGSHRRPA